MGSSAIYSKVIQNKLDKIIGCLLAVDGIILVNDNPEADFVEGLHYIEEIMAGAEFRSQGEIDFFKDKDENIIQTLLALFWTYVPIPLDRVHDLEDVRNSSFIAIDENSKQFATACKRFSREIRFMPPVDLWERLQLCRSAKFGLYSSYISTMESVKWIQNWLNYLFGVSEGKVFLNQLFQLINSTTI